LTSHSYTQIVSHIKQALDDVYYGLKNPKRALDDAATIGGGSRMAASEWDKCFT
jgi:hypothetical protein